jgi:hypothetical protein
MEMQDIEEEGKDIEQVLGLTTTRQIGDSQSFRRRKDKGFCTLLFVVLSSHNFPAFVLPLPKVFSKGGGLGETFVKV